MVNKYMKARKLAKLLQLLKEFNLDPRDIRKQVEDLKAKLSETQKDLDVMCRKLDALEKRATETTAQPKESTEQGLSFYEMYQEMMTGEPTKAVG